MTQTADASRCHALGEARLKVADEAKTEEDWERLWTESPAYPFTWGQCWKQMIEYRVDDYAAEVGFFIDVVGLPTNAFGREFSMFTGPENEFFFSVAPTPEGEASTPRDGIRLAFMLGDIEGQAATLKERGVAFEQEPTPYQGSPMLKATFRTPHGIAVDLWGFAKQAD
jgi:hypothetical protein